MSNDLKVLAENRDALLLAEAVAWLHDMGKCDERFLQQSASDYNGPKPYHYKTEYSSLVGTRSLELLGQPPVPLKTLIEESRPGIINDLNKHLLVRILGYCHGAAHTEKEEAYHLLRQTTADTRLSSPFGCESEPLVDLKAKLNSLPFSQLLDRPIFKSRVEEVFSNAYGDTRRPINEVTLWDWSNIVAAFYKAALASALLGARVDPSTDLYWRLLSVRLNGAAFSERVARIPDLLVRQKLITDGLNRICVLLEETYPLGTEVYRDEDGSVFIVPNIQNLLAVENGQGEHLFDLIIQKFSAGTIKDQTLQLDGEVIPLLNLDEGEPWTRLPNISRYKHQDPLPISKHLEETLSSHADLHSMSSWWRSHSEDICTVCQLRPQGWRVAGNEAHYDRRSRGKKCLSNCQTCKALERKVCGICEERREDRSKEWATKGLDTTIWIDEIADVNGRIALVVGKFDLEHWLDGEMLFYPGVQGEMIETQTPARLYRVWETTQTFWEKIKSNFKTSVGEINPRLRIRASLKPEADASQTLGDFHTYELKLSNVNLSVTHVGEEEFLTVDNLERVAVLLHPSEKPPENYTAAANRVLNRLQLETKLAGILIEEPTGYGSPNKMLGTLRITEVTLEEIPYIPATTILTEPSTFMAIVPAGKALEVAKCIKSKYEKEMGKVRNRLPITLGLVFAGRRTPLPAILDAGRRMLKQPTLDELWRIDKIDRGSQPKEVELTVKRDEHTLLVKVPTVMGDGVTEDDWYPYWYVEKDITGAKPSGRQGRYKGINAEDWLHVCNLQEGDAVHLMPSRIDFEFLDTAARRFEISYDDGKRRGLTHPSRPYYLEQLEDFEKLWDILAKSNKLAISQIHNFVGIIEAKRMEWTTGQGERVFEQMVRDALYNANWEPRPSKDDFKRLEQAALSGQLADVVELYLRILKEPI